MSGLLSAIISGASSLVVPIARALRNRFRRLTGSKPRQVSGKWKGQATENFLDGQKNEIWLRSTVCFDLRQSGDRITGEAQAHSNNEQVYNLSIEGNLECSLSDDESLFAFS